MKANAKFIPAAALCASAFLLASCAATAPAPETGTPQSPAPHAKRTARGTEIQTALKDYTYDSASEFRCLGQGSGDTEADAIAAARENARERMVKRIDGWKLGVGSAPALHALLKSELTKEIRESEPDPWVFNDDASPAFTALVGVALDKSRNEEIMNRIRAEAAKENRLRAPLDAVAVGNHRVPATISTREAKNAYRDGEDAVFSVTAERNVFLMIFSANLENQAVVFPFEDGRNFRPLRAGETFEKNIRLTVENPGDYAELCQLVFVLTTDEPNFRAGQELEVFSPNEIAEWLNSLPPASRFVHQIELTVAR